MRPTPLRSRFAESSVDTWHLAFPSVFKNIQTCLAHREQSQCLLNMAHVSVLHICKVSSATQNCGLVDVHATHVRCSVARSSVNSTGPSSWLVYESQPPKNGLIRISSRVHDARQKRIPPAAPSWQGLLPLKLEMPSWLKGLNHHDPKLLVCATLKSQLSNRVFFAIRVACRGALRNSHDGFQLPFHSDEIRKCASWAFV